MCIYIYIYAYIYIHLYIYIYIQVRENMLKAEKVMIVNGWGHYELLNLWKEMSALGSHCANPEYPCSKVNRHSYVT